MVKKNTKKESDNLKQEEEKKNKDVILPELDEEQIKRFDLNLQHIVKAKQQRNEPRREFDDMTYEQDYFYNKDAGNAYLPKKRNDDETRVNTGTIEKKIEVLINEVMAMNLQPEGQVYDADDNEIRSLGQDMVDIVKRTCQIEKDDSFWIEFLKELLTQRAAFIQEIDTVQYYFSATFKRPEKKLISGLRVYLGDINIPARLFQTQPYIIIYTKRSYTEAETIYKKWNRWEFVRAGAYGGDKDTPFRYRMNSVGSDEVEELHIINPITNEYDIIINGIPMMEKPTALPWHITPDRRYNMEMFIIKPLDTDFAYGKQPVASAKFLQGLKDETIRLLINKMRQAIQPPIGTKKGKIYSKDIWAAGAVTQGVGKEDFSILTDHDGVTQSEFNMYQLIENKTEEFIGSGSLQQGISESGEQTATEVQQLQVNSVKNLFLIIFAYSRAKRDMTYLRIYNLLENFVQPKKRSINRTTGKLMDIYSKFTINNIIFENGKKGKKIIQFVDKPLTGEDKENIYGYERKEEELGRPVRIRAINVKELKAIPLFWNIVVNPQPREGSQLEKVLFKDKLTQAIGIENASQGQKQVNWDKMADDMESTWKTQDLFKKEAPQSPGQGQQEGQGEGGDLVKEIEDFERSAMGSQQTEGIRRSNQKPSLNRMENNIQ
jgi:hypothetical protein